MLRKIVLKGMYYSGMQSVLSPYTKGTGAILMLHHVKQLPKNSYSPNHHLSISPKFLEKLIISVKEKGYEFVSMDEAAKRLKQPKQHKHKQKPFVCMTLDDGYKNNMNEAVPIFRKHEVPYLIYIAPGLVEGEAPLWWEDLETVIAQKDMLYVDMPDGRRDYDTSSKAKKSQVFNELSYELLFKLPEDVQRQIMKQLVGAHKIDSVAHVKSEIMTWNEIVELEKDPLCTIGAHTVGHYALAKLSDEVSRREIRESRDIIKSETGKCPKHFAYPYGHAQLAGQREFDIAIEEGFETAVTTRHGVLVKKHANHMTALPRVSINGNYQTTQEVKTLLSGLPTLLQNKGSYLNVG